MNDAAFCEAMLPRVSRTFALCIRLLPRDLEYPVLVAYLLCRIADTIEDTADLDDTTKARLLRRFGAWLNPENDGPGDVLTTFAAPRDDEELLANHADAVVREFRLLPVDQRDSIRPWVQEMADGMAEFAERRRDDPERLHALRTLDDLDRYCYFVAGTVGHMLTALYQTGGRQFSPGQARQLTELATSFGLGLQLTNIIKDIRDDRERGWSYVPDDVCEQAGITPRDMHDPEHAEAAQKVMGILITKAETHLEDARTYTQALPRLEYHIRLFCLTSMYFAVRTLALARRDQGHFLRPEKLKISRQSVYATLLGASVVAPSNRLIDLLYRRLASA